MDFSAWRSSGRMTPELATSCLGVPIPAGSFVSIRRVVEIRLDGRRRAAEPAGDLGNRQALGLAEVAGQGNGASPLTHAIERRR